LLIRRGILRLLGLLFRRAGAKLRRRTTEAAFCPEIAVLAKP
jgi:hypothetical protein